MPCARRLASNRPPHQSAPAPKLRQTRGGVPNKKVDRMTTTPITDRLRELIANSELSQAEIARGSGVPQPRISNFLRGVQLRGASLDKLAAFFGEELRPARRRKTSSP